MNHSIWATLIGSCWIIFFLYWVVASGFVKKTAREDSRAVRLVQVALLVPAALLLFNPVTRVGFLGRRFVPDAASIAALGTLLTASGIGIAIWARYHIGQNWSSRVTLKRDHTLIQTGPYAVMRHPIYSGLLLAFFGTALARGEWRGLVAVMLILLSHSWKALREEALMRTAFGPEYDEYRRRTGFIFPRFSSYQ
jgi:protein-S-isoprenylcysteine O-methyltransferase Ste14